MKLPARLRALGAAALFSATVPAHAQQCDVFTDVLATDSFCTSVQWLRNRAITLGCAAAQYCPGNNVTRAQMALFMNRLGVALSPVFLGGSGLFAGAALGPNQFVPVCPTSTITAVSYRRLARIRGHVSVPASGSTAMAMFLVYDDGAPGDWQNANISSLLVPNPNGHQNLAWASETVSLQPNTEYRFGIGLANPANAAGNLTVGLGPCSVDVTIVNDNPFTPPFDR